MRAGQRLKSRRPAIITGEEDTPLSRTITVRSRSRQELIEITPGIHDALHEMGAGTGVCHIFVPHTTAGIIVNENADPDVASDMLDWLDSAVPQSRPFRHAEGTSPAHIKATLVGQWATIPLQDGRLALGTWQGVFLAEFDVPRSRVVVIKVVTA